MQSNYNGPDSDFIMVSSPRLIDFEILILDFALDLIEYYGKSHLFHRSTLDQDIKAHAHS